MRQSKYSGVQNLASEKEGGEIATQLSGEEKVCTESQEDFPFLYSVIIAHYNSSCLLRRMLSSIPERGDIQVIIVDDASIDEEHKALKRLAHRNLQIYHQTENHGAGYARNIGLNHAKGRWLLIVDADDMFCDGAFEVLDEYKNANIDYLCYVIERYTSDGKPAGDNISNKSVKTYLEDPSKKNLMLFKYRNFVNWNKMVSLSFIRNNNMRFEECKVNNDVYFNLQIGLFARRFKVIGDVLYRAIVNDNSITRKKRNVEREFEFYLQTQKRNGFYKKMGLTRYPYYRATWLYAPFLIRKHGLKFVWKFFLMCYSRRNDIMKARKAYLSLFDKMKGTYSN